MKSFRFILTLTAVFVLAVTAAQGQNARTWVSGAGSDSNPCTRLSPCLTFQGAYAKTTVGGEIDALDDGEFGTVTITNSITIDGGSHLAAISSGVSSYGIYVAAPAGSTITLRNLSIRNSASAKFGVRALNQVYTLHIEHCVISGFSGDGIFVGPGQAAAINFYLDDSIIRDNETGVNLVGGVTANISNSHLLGNYEVGFDGSGYGLNLAMTNSEISGSLYGFSFYAVDAPTSTASIANSVVANNQYGVLARGADAAVTLSNVSLFNNTTAGISIFDGAVVTSFQNNANTGTN